MKKLVLLLVLGLLARTGFSQTYFTMDSIWVPPYICQAADFNVEVYGYVSSGMVQATSQNYFVSHDTVYAQFHFGPTGGGIAMPLPMSRTINIQAPGVFARYKVVAQGFYNGQLQHTLTSAIIICWNVNLAAPEEIKNQPILGVYPNPTQDNIRITFTSQAATLKLTDVAGKTVRYLSLPIGVSETQLDLNGLSAGLYLLQVIGADGIFSQKIIKH